KRLGGLHAAAGDLRSEAKDSIRLALLGIIFKSAGLPGDFPRACFRMWLREGGLEDGVVQYVKKAGGRFGKGRADLYVSDLIAKAILSARKDFADKPADAKLQFRSQFPPDPKDVSIDDMIAKIKQAIGKKGKLPCTLVVLDEVQQHIGESAD